MALKETLPQGSKLLTWLDNSDFEQPKQQQLIIPPFMYTIMVSLIWECKQLQELFEKKKCCYCTFKCYFSPREIRKNQKSHQCPNYL